MHGGRMRLLEPLFSEDMVTDAVPKQKTVLATPLNVEESRAQRQQRSQARFRDRGGIFVPSNRSTLANILLGKAPPLSRRRSISQSPSTHLQKGAQPTKLRRISPPTKQKTPARMASKSPQKKSRKSTRGPKDNLTGEQSLHSKHPKGMPASKFVAVSTKTKAKGTGAKKHRETGMPETEDESRKPKRKNSTSKPLPEVSEREVEVEVNASKASRAKTKDGSSRSTHRTLSVDSNIKGHSSARFSHISDRVSVGNSGTAVGADSIPYVRQVPADSSPTSSKLVMKKPARSRRKTSDLYSDASEDEYIPKVSKSRAKPRTSTSTTSKPAHRMLVREPPQTELRKLTNIIEEDEEAEENPPHQVESTSIHSAPSRTIPEKENNVSKGENRAAQAEGQDEFLPTPPTKQQQKSVRCQAKDPKEPHANAKIEGSKKESKGLEEESPRTAVEGFPLSQPVDPSSSRSKRNVVKSRRRPANDEHEDEPRSAAMKLSKRIRDEAAEETSTRPPTKRVASERNVPTSRKRSREQEEDAVEEVKPTKRRKEVPGRVKAGKPESTAEAKKASSKQKAPAKVTKKPPSKAKVGKGALKNRANSDVVASGTSIPRRRGPPRSVLQRLKVLQSQPLVVDNEPDPIDFLS